MDELTNSLATSFGVSSSENNIYNKHPRFNLYKQRTSREADQNVRRQNKLKQQKERRCNFQNHARGLALGEFEDKEEEESSEMDVDQSNKKVKRYKDQLMLSEWLVEVPDDFESDWLMVVCPLGKRNLVVASRGRTVCYSKSGFCIDTFASCLPGGSYSTNSGYTVLDCVYVEISKTFVVLDVMCWNSHPVYDSETDFRFFWLNSKFSETNGLTSTSKNNTYKFEIPKRHECTKDSILKGVNESDMNTVDGLLFYHKRTHYTFGSTPLVTWLKVEMLKDILNISPYISEQ
ncbi:snurportin-1 [Ciona intestinalis]